jgi:hypothetical protein
MSEAQQQSQTDLHDLVQDLDLNKPLYEFIEDPALIEQAIEIDQQELERLDAVAREYYQELQERGMLPDLPPMDIDPKLLEPTEEIDRGTDFER